MLAKLLVASTLVVTIIPFFLPTAVGADTNGFNPDTDGLVTNFENYQSFGGQSGVAVSSISYNQCLFAYGHGL